MADYGFVSDFIERHAVVLEEVFEAAEERGIRVQGRDRNAKLASLRAAPTDRVDELAESFIMVAKRRSAVRGAVAGFGGLPAAIIAAPVEVHQTAAVTVRMASAVMTSYGFSTKTEEGRQDLLVALAVGFGVDKITIAGTTYLLSNYVAAEVGQQATKKLLPKAVAPALLKQLSKRLALREGAKRSLVRAAPGVGAVIGAAVNWAAAARVGKRVKNRYRQRHLDLARER